MTQEQAQQLATAISTFALIGGLVSLALLIIVIFAYWKIFSKAGYSGALSLLMLIPIVNIIMFFYLAFSKWPVLQEVEALRARGGQYQPQQQYPPQQYQQR